MSENSSIEWTDHTWSPVWGCTEVSTAESGGGGCDNCYARVLANRFGTKWGHDAPRREFGDAHWHKPVVWNERARKAGTKTKVFPSMCDPFDKDWPEGVRERFWALIEATPNLTWLLLTKRIGNVRGMVPARWLDKQWPAHVRIGATMVNQPELDRDVGKLLSLRVPNFLSLEPLLGRIDLCETLGIWWNSTMRCFEGSGPRMNPRGLDWVIVGAESGPHARPAHLDWFRTVRDTCKAAGVAILVKQLGQKVLDDGMSSPGQHWPASMVREAIPRFEAGDPPFLVHLQHSKGGDWMEWPDDLRVREFPA